MFMPFLPYLLAIAGVSVLEAMPVARVPVSGTTLAVLFVVLPLLGSLLGQLPERLLGGRRRAPVRRRMLFLGAWLGLLALAPLPAALERLLGEGAGLGEGETAALIALLLNFWLGDTLAVSPLHLFQREGRPERLRRFGAALRMPVPILVLVLAGLVLPVLSDELLLPRLGRAQEWPWLKLLGSMGSLAFLAMLAVPVLIRTCWGLRPLPDGPAAQAVREELAANGVPVAAVLAWPDAMMGHATAGVIGLLPRFRYLLVSPTLLSALTPEELRSVTAHEAGHLKHRHLWYYFVAVVTFILALQVAAAGLFWAGLLTGATPPLWLLLTLEAVALVVFFRFGVGFLSRHFERQADGNALRRLGPLSFEGAIAKVARLNAIPVELDNWHHYGIGRRIAYVREAHADPARLQRHDRKVARIKLALLVLLALCVSAQATASNGEAMGWLGERYLAYRLSGEAEPSQAELLPLQYMASRALQRGDRAAAQHYFRTVLRITPEDAQAQNNLAWVLVTAPDPQPGDLREGLSLARRAAKAQEQAYIWDTLAESHYRLRQYEDAVHAATKALLLAEAGAGRGDVPLRYYRDRLAGFANQGRGA